MNTITGEHQARLLAVCFSLEMKLGLCGVTFQTRRDWDETWVRHSREEKHPWRPYVFVFTDKHSSDPKRKTSCQQSILTTPNITNINNFTCPDIIIK